MAPSVSSLGRPSWWHDDMADGITERGWKKERDSMARETARQLGGQSCFFPTAHSQRKEQESLIKYADLFCSLCSHILQDSLLKFAPSQSSHTNRHARLTFGVTHYTQVAADSKSKHEMNLSHVVFIHGT